MIVDMVQKVKVLGLVINSVDMKLFLLQERLINVQNKCLVLKMGKKTTLLELTKLVDLSTSAIKTEIPNHLGFFFTNSSRL